jgi:uncharacterized protein (TIGR02302 family)
MADPVFAGLARRRRLALGVLWAEALAASFWPAAAFLAAFLGLCFAGLPAALPVLPHLLFLAGALAGFAWLLRHGLRGFASPGQAEAERRLEADSGLRHRPLDVLRDRPAGVDADDPLWLVHRANAPAALGRLRLRGPQPGLAPRDPYALRVAAGVLLLACVVAAGPSPWRGLGRSLFGFAFGPPGAAPVLQAWIEPPAYTGLAPIFLAADGRAVSVPDGSKLTVSLTGGRFRPRLGLAGSSERFRVLGPGSWQALAVLHRSGRLRISRLFGTVAQWQLTVLPNSKPAIAWAGKPGQAEKTLETRLPWHVAQRWGVAALQAELRPAGHDELPPIDLPIPLPGTPKDAGGAAQADLVANPYAGLDMAARLTGRDVSGQTGSSDTVIFRLPGRVFHDTLAKAIADVRRRLALNPHGQTEAADDIDALAGAPDRRAAHAGMVLNLAAAAALLRADASAAGTAEAQDRLWTIALALDGALPAPSEQNLAAASDSLRHALDERQRGKASDSDLARRIEALRKALSQRLNDIARAQRNEKTGQAEPRPQTYGSPVLDKMLKELQQAVREGRMEDARQKLAELQSLMDRLKTAKVLSPEEARQAAEGQKRAKQMLGAVQDLVQREGQLMDNGQSRAPRATTPQSPFRPWGQPGSDPAQEDANQKAQAGDARTQQALARALDALKRGVGEAGRKVPEGFNEASGDMDQARQKLQAGDDRAARDAEGRAVAALQQGGKDMRKQMSQNRQLAISPGGQGQDGEDEEEGLGDEPGGQSADGKRDPLGRQVEGTGGRAADDGSVHLPPGFDPARSRAIQDELRRRGADRERPQRELDYIDRLLKPFSE